MIQVRPPPSHGMVMVANEPPLPLLWKWMGVVKAGVIYKTSLPPCGNGWGVVKAGVVDEAPLSKEMDGGS